MGGGEAGARQAKQWRSSLRQYAFRLIGERLVSAVTSTNILQILTLIWYQKPETAPPVLARIHTLTDWAETMDCRPDNPCDRVKKTLPRQKDVRKHMRALPHGEVAAVIATTQRSGAWLATRLAFKVLVLTAARSGEVRTAKWNEIELFSYSAVFFP